MINKRPASVLQKKRVCAYARVSTDSRRQEDSLENQMETYERLITGNPEYEFIGVFADQGISGYCENRPQFQRMMEKARAEEIDLIITKSISRFARNTVTVLKFARELKELGVGIFLKNRTLTLYQGTVRLCLPSSLLLHRKKAENFQVVCVSVMQDPYRTVWFLVIHIYMDGTSETENCF